MLRAEIGRIKPLEENVNSLDTAVKCMQGSLSNLESGQKFASCKLDKLALIMARLLPPTEEVGMETDEQSPSSTNRAQPIPNKINKQGPPDTRKRSINGQTPNHRNDPHPTV